MHSLDRLPMLLIGLQLVCDMDATDHQDTIVLSDLSTYISAEVAFSSTDPARLQRASEGSGQSAAGRRHDIVERRSDFTVGIGTIVLLDRSVNAELDRAIVGREIGASERACDPVDPDVGRVHGI
jgi:hypothetical protein